MTEAGTSGRQLREATKLQRLSCFSQPLCSGETPRQNQKIDFLNQLLRPCVRHTPPHLDAQAVVVGQQCHAVGAAGVQRAGLQLGLETGQGRSTERSKNYLIHYLQPDLGDECAVRLFGVQAARSNRKHMCDGSRWRQDCSSTCEVCTRVLDVDVKSAWAQGQRACTDEAGACSHSICTLKTWECSACSCGVFGACPLIAINSNAHQGQARRPAAPAGVARTAGSGRRWRWSRKLREGMANACMWVRQHISSWG